MDRKRMVEHLKATCADELFKRADEVRKCYVGDEVHIRGIIEFSNYCIRNCLYCGLRRDNRSVNRYRMGEADIIEVAKAIVSSGVKTVVLQSGDDPFYTQKRLCRLIEAIKSLGDVAITLSIGERKLEDYRTFRDAGADRYLLKHETINESLYAFLHPGQSLKDRVRILSYLKELGYQIGSGNIVGLPYQSIEDIADDIIFLKEMEVDMAGIGPFVPQKCTPLGKFAHGSVDLTLRALALVRINMPFVHLPATTAVATLDPVKGQIKALKAGCNVIMPNFTPKSYSSSYTIYDDKVEVTLERAREVVRAAGRRISTGRGDSLRPSAKRV